MVKQDYLILKRLQQRFHALPLDRAWLKKRFGKEGEKIYKVLQEAVDRGELVKAYTIDWYVVYLDERKWQRKR